uniref:Uncharacterized protein n=1 Tax=Ornithorhynchus anatinus TaxID=9258 RepID=A0A6I8P3X5_ORNAN
MGIKSVSLAWDNLITLYLPQRLEQCSAHSKHLTNANIIIILTLALDSSSASKGLLKVAASAAQLEKYQKTTEIYKQDYHGNLFKDALSIQLVLEKYEEMFLAFTDSRECKLLKKLLDAHEEQNSKAYTEAVPSPFILYFCIYSRCFRVVVTESVLFPLFFDYRNVSEQ